MKSKIYMRRKKNWFSKMVKYGAVGVLGTVLHLLLIIFLVEFMKMDPVLSSVIGFVIVLIFSYLLNKKWTFNSNSEGYMEFFRYTVVSLIGLLLNTAIMYFTVKILGWYYLYGQLLVIAVVPISNFVLNNFWAFKQKKDIQANYKNKV